MIIGIDFDGTCTTHSFPAIGADIGAVPVLKGLVEAGHKLILWTMRSDTDHPYLQDAVDWFIEHDIPLFGINQNPQQKHWTKSPKAYCQLYIDDAALGIPLKENPIISQRKFVDWDKTEQLLIEEGVL